MRQHEIHALFLQWVNDNYRGMEAEEVKDHYVQSGEYPDSFFVYIENIESGYDD